MIGNVHRLRRNENILKTVRKEIITGYAGTKIFTIFDNKLVMPGFSVVIISVCEVLICYTGFYAEL